MPPTTLNRCAAVALVATAFTTACGGASSPTTPSPTVSAIVVTPGTDTLVSLGATRTFSATAKDASGKTLSGITFTWSTSAPNVATVDSASGLVTAVANGSATISASAAGVAGKATISVSQQVSTISVSPGTDTLLALGDTRTFVASAKDALGNAIAGATVTWSAADPSIATVNSATGVATAIGNGSTTISASANGVSGQASVAVAQAVSSVTVTPGTAGLSAIGDTVRFSAVAQDANGNAVSNVAFLWVSSDATVATVDTAGLLTAKGSGGAIVTAAARGVPGNATVTVSQTATQLAFSVEPSTVGAGAAIDPAVQVEVRDGGGQLDATSRAAITISIANNPATGTLSGTKTVNAVGGIATFSGLWIDHAATGYTLQATSASLTSATSTSFDVSAGPATTLTFTQQPPASVPVNTVMAPAVTVEIRDAYGNVVPTGQVDVAISATPWPDATLGGTLSAAASGGTATFADLQTDRPGTGYTLIASSGSVTATSAAFHATLTLDTLSAGGGHACGLTASGAAYCWGLNTSGQLGNGTSSSDSVPVRVAPGLTFSSISAGGSHTCGVSGTAIYCWGDGTSGQLGQGAFSSSASPVQVTGGHAFTAVSAGNAHTCALTTTGATYCWGNNTAGQLGDNSTANADAPVALSGSYTFVEISAGNLHTCALTSVASGYVYCWGRNIEGELGNGTFNTDSVPVLAMSTAVAVAVGGNQSCAMGWTYHHIFCWGDNTYGELGDGTLTNRNVPTAVVPADSWTGLSLGSRHSCAYSTSNPASPPSCWGSDDAGQLGNGTIQSWELGPTGIFGGLNIVAIHGGGAFTCGRVSAGAVYCWGANDWGQLGIGSTGAASLPTRIVQ